MIINTEGIVIRMGVSDISSLGRITSGVKLIDMDLEKNVTVASIAKVREDDKKDSDAVVQELEEQLESEN